MTCNVLDTFCLRGRGIWSVYQHAPRFFNELFCELSLSTFSQALNRAECTKAAKYTQCYVDDDKKNVKKISLTYNFPLHSTPFALVVLCKTN